MGKNLWPAFRCKPKNIFLSHFASFFVFCYILCFSSKNLKNIFLPAFGLRGTQKMVKIFNMYHFTLCQVIYNFSKESSCLFLSASLLRFIMQLSRLSRIFNNTDLKTFLMYLMESLVWAGPFVFLVDNAWLLLRVSEMYILVDS